MQYASEEFLDKQRTRLSHDVFANLSVAFVKYKDGNFKKANPQVHLRIATFIAKVSLISQEAANDMIVMMKRCTHVNGKEIPLPSRYVQIRKNLLKSFRHLMPTINVFSFPKPYDLFGA